MDITLPASIPYASSVLTTVKNLPRLDNTTYNGNKWYHGTRSFHSWSALEKAYLPKPKPPNPLQIGVRAFGEFHEYGTADTLPQAQAINKALESLLEREMRFAYANLLPTPKHTARGRKSEAARQRDLQNRPFFKGVSVPERIRHHLTPQVRSWLDINFNMTAKK